MSFLGGKKPKIEELREGMNIGIALLELMGIRNGLRYMGTVLLRKTEHVNDKTLVSAISCIRTLTTPEFENRNKSKKAKKICTCIHSSPRTH